jgi:hypothetical protein
MSSWEEDRMTKTPKPSVQFEYPTEARGRIPSFSSIEEEADFWDTHDSTDFLDSLVPVEVSIGPGFRRTVTLQLSPDESDRLNQLAMEEGTEPADLARQWVVSHLRKTRAS